MSWWTFKKLSSLDHKFTILYNQDNLLRLILNMSQYEGGAHEMFGATNMMFDLRIGNVQDIKDMLQKDGKQK